MVWLVWAYMKLNNAPAYIFSKQDIEKDKGILHKPVDYGQKGEKNYSSTQLAVITDPVGKLLLKHVNSY